MVSYGFGATALKFASYDDDLSRDKPLAVPDHYSRPNSPVPKFRS